MADWRTCSAEVTAATLTLGSDGSCGCRPWGEKEQLCCCSRLISVDLKVTRIQS